jgi:hypothetical protein
MAGFDLKQSLDSEVERDASIRKASSTKRTVRAELIVATLALVTSACASVAAILQTREATVQTRASIAQAETVAKQLGASVWPYLTIDDDFSPNSVGIGVTNQGLGPALIRGFTMEVDGRPLERLRDLSLFIDPAKGRRNFDAEVLGRGSVIRPSESLRVFSLSDPRLAMAHAQGMVGRTHIYICYCSLLKDCWSLRPAGTIAFLLTARSSRYVLRMSLTFEKSMSRTSTLPT